jgi:hypothetical protein
MKKTDDSATPNVEAEEMPEHDFSKGIRGKYYERAKSGAVTVRLDPDVASAFPNDEAVNEGLRTLLRIRRGETAEH